MSGMNITKTCTAISTADFNQWLHAMRMVVRLPGEVPPEFRKKLWVSLAERYLHIKKVEWDREAVRCLSEKWKSDDEELADQIIKDLHRTGSSFCSGSVNQAKLKRVLVGYARWNKEVGYCQGFNMLGALILQVVDTDEASAIKIMIYLIEGVLPPGYFSGALTGLQADMGVFRELLSTRLPRLSQHLQKLQGLTTEGLEPPLINVFTMQWFLTLFCTCLPINCVLRVWDLTLTDGGDVLLRTALALWELLEPRILTTRTADDFYCKMGVLSGDMLNGSLIEPNELVQRVVAMGAIHGLHKLRDKHLNDIKQWKDKRKLRLFYSDDDAESDDDSKVAMATLWGLRLHRRASTGGASRAPISASGGGSASVTDREKIALDINLLKQQYGKLRQRQKQAQIILTAACARQTHTSATPSSSTSSSPSLTLNNLLAGRSAITSNKGRRAGAPLGAIPPARNAAQGKTKSSSAKPPKLPPETLHWKDTESSTSRMRRNSLKWKDIAKDEPVIDTNGKEEKEGREVDVGISSAKISRLKYRNRSESSSYSEDSDSSTDTDLCDDENVSGGGSGGVKDSGSSSIEASPFKKPSKTKSEVKVDEVPIAEKILDLKNCIESLDKERGEEDVEEEVIKDMPVEVETEDLPITSTSQLSPVADFSQYLNVSSISPLKTPSSPFDLTEMLTTLSPSPENNYEATNTTTSELGMLQEDVGHSIAAEGVTNTYFERINSVERRPSNLDLTESEDVSRTFECNNSSLSIPTYEIIDVDEMEEDGAQSLGRSTSLNVLQNPGMRFRSEIGPDNAQEVTKIDGMPSDARVKAKSHLGKGKSSSLEDTKRPVLKKSLPVSCSETIEIRNSEKALEIIQENSKILHRILKKNACQTGTSSSLTSREECEPVGTIVIESDNVVIIPEEDEVPSTTLQAVAEDDNGPEKKTTATSISDTLSSIEHTIKSINSLCQDRESMFGRTTRSKLMESIEEIINSGNAIKVQIDSSDDISRKLNPTRSPSPLSPIREQQGHVNDVNGGRESPARELGNQVTAEKTASEYRPWTTPAKDKDYYLCKLDKSPSSPIITRSYLDSLKPTAATVDTSNKERVTKSAENSPSHSLSRTLGYENNDNEFDLNQRSEEAQEFLDKYLARDRDYLIRDSRLEGGGGVVDNSKGLFDYGGIEPRKHKSLEFDAI